MRAEDRITQLETDLAAERAEKAELQERLSSMQQQMETLLAYVAQLEGRLAKDSHNSSNPPSSDRHRHQNRSQRTPSGKKSGGQPGHAGQCLLPSETPDEIVRHRPSQCPHCQQPLEAV